MLSTTPRPRTRPRPTAADRRFAEQLRPLVVAYDDVRNRAHAPVDVPRARRRVRSGRPAFDAATLLDASGDLTQAFRRTTAAFERTGIVSTLQVAELRRADIDVTALVLGWANGGAAPVDASANPARTIAGVVGNAILSHAARRVADGFSFSSWRWTSCPCCGASPDLALTTPTRRTLVCWRCDSMWRTDQHGCLGCGADAPPTVARVESRVLGYELTICNQCERYLKERHGQPSHELLVERALTAGLDEAAQQRGLHA